MSQFKEMVNKLKYIDDLAWGRYILERDILYNKINKEELDQLIKDAIECGISYADKVLAQTATSNVTEIAQKLGIDIVSAETKPGAKRLVFATFNPPKKITIMETPLRQIRSYVKELDSEDSSVFTSSKMRDLLISHEIFHFIEEKHKNDIYTRNKKIILWKLFNYEHKSQLRSLSEIAGMYFAKRLTDFAYCPLMLDVILFYPFDSKGALLIGGHILDLNKKVRESSNAK